VKIVKFILILHLCFFTTWLHASDDPLKSALWAYISHKHLEGKPYTFDERILVSGPDFAENSAQVPIRIDATQFPAEQIEKIIVFVDFNPISYVLTFKPIQQVKPIFSTKIKLEKASPVRAALLDKKDTWHIGGVFIRASGGGCALPPSGDQQASLKNLLNTKSHVVARSSSTRIKLKTVHPMSTGLQAGSEEFYVKNLTVLNDKEEVMAEIEMTAAVAQDPSFNLTSEIKSSVFLIELQDSKGNITKKRIESND